MSTVGFATLDVIPSVRGLRSELQKQTSGDLAAAGKVGGKKFGDTAGKEAATGFKGHLATAAADVKKMLSSPLAGAAIGAGIVLGFKDVVSSASAAEQATGGVQAVFKQYADDVIADSKKAAQGLGLSATAYQELITLSGALLKNKGIEDFAEQGESLVKIGADLAAQFGGSTRDAVDALNAAMRGESDPIERYAISLNETAINAVLAEQGMDGLKGAALDQAKTQARLTLIMQQSADAAGAFGRESDTLAGQQARLSAEWADMRTELGEKLLPATAAFVGFLNSEGIPALATAGGVAKDVGGAIASLPSPVKAAAAAFVALRIASATGLSGGIASGASSARGAIDDLRIRTMLAADAFTGARTSTRAFADTTAQVSSGVGRLSASMSAARVATTGLGGAMRSSLRGGLALMGGPWGLALIAGTALLSKFIGEQQEAKARVDELTATLDKQTAGITANTRETVANTLEKEGAFKAAQTLGIALSDVTDAALGNADAIARIQERYAELNATDINTDQFNAMKTLGEATGDTSTAIDGAVAAQKRLNSGLSGSTAATDTSADATKDATAALETYKDRINEVRSELRKLMDKEKERALTAIQNRRDRIALIETLKAAREEAGKGKRTLDENTKAGRDNMTALLDLADQWASSTPKVTNARGAYEAMRNKFVEVATQMGATKAEAKNLADQLIKVPKNAKVEFQSKGYRELMAQIAAIKAAAALGPAQFNFDERGFTGSSSFPLPTRPTPSGDRDKAGDGDSGTSPRAGVIIERLEAHGANLPEILRDAERKVQMRNLGGFK